MRIGRRELVASLSATALPAASTVRSKDVAAQPLPGIDGSDIRQQVAHRTALMDLPPTEGGAVFLAESGREGLFICRAGSAPSDPRQGIHVRSKAAGFYWERHWDRIHGQPEWFGAVADSSKGAIPADNLAALTACVALCPVTLLRNAAYFTSDTWKIQTSNRTVKGANQSIESPYDGGTRIICTDLAKDVIQVGGDSPGSRPAIIRLDDVTAGWGGNLTPPSSGNEIDAPKAFRVQYVLAAYLDRCFALDPIIGFYFHGIINTRCVNYGVTRTVKFGGVNDFFRAVWCRGTPRLFAGGNASLYLMDGNVTLAANIRAALVHPVGVYMDGDFADTYILGLETSNVPFPIEGDGAAGTYDGGHGDIHIRGVVFDQIIGNGITFTNLHPLAGIHIDGGYIQIVSTGPNKGLWLEGGNGQITVSNLQIYGENADKSSIGIYIKDQPNVTLSPTVMVMNIAYPLHISGISPRIDVQCHLNAGLNDSRGTRPAMSIAGGTLCHIRPKISGPANCWSKGIELVGSGHANVSIDPTMVDRSAIRGGVKASINGMAITSPGYYTGSGRAGSPGTGVFVTGIVG